MTVLGFKGCGAWGDILWSTPIFKNGNYGKVILHNDNQSRWVAPVFNGLADVEYSDNPPERLYIKNKEKTHSAQRLLIELGLDKDRTCIPEVKITEEEVNWAKNFLKNFKNPVAIVNENSGISDPNNLRSHYVCPPSSVIEDVVFHLNKCGHDVIQFTNNKERIISGACAFSNLNVRQIMACYKVIGKMVGGDTGHYHAMLAVGGKTLTLIPDHSVSYGYDYNDLLYKDHLWKNEEVRVQYVKYYANKNVIEDYITHWLLRD